MQTRITVHSLPLYQHRGREISHSSSALVPSSPLYIWDNEHNEHHTVEDCSAAIAIDGIMYQSKQLITWSAQTQITHHL